MEFQYLDDNKKQMARKKYEQIVDLMADHKKTYDTITNLQNKLNTVSQKIAEGYTDLNAFCQSMGCKLEDVETEFPELRERFNVKAFGPNYKDKFLQK